MSKTFNLVCPETKKAIWCGQRDRIYGDVENLKCTAARNAGRTRVEQIQWELANPNVNENPPCCETCGMFTSQCQCWDAVNGVD